MKVNLIVAASLNNCIGKDNKLLWHLPNDLKYFKNITWGFPVIMGRKTFESVNKPLPGRTNIVITRQNEWHFPGVVSVASLEEALQKAAATNALELFIIGGGEIYQQSLPIADRIYLTRVETEINGDAFFPEISSPAWQLKFEDKHERDEKHLYNYDFQVWEPGNLD